MEFLMKYVIYGSFALNIICGLWVAVNVVAWVKTLGGKKD